MIDSPAAYACEKLLKGRRMLQSMRARIRARLRQHHAAAWAHTATRTIRRGVSDCESTDPSVGQRRPSARRDRAVDAGDRAVDRAVDVDTGVCIEIGVSAALALTGRGAHRRRGGTGGHRRRGGRRRCEVRANAQVGAFPSIITIR